MVPREALQGANEDLQARTCEALARNLLVDKSSDVSGLDTRSKYEMGRTKIFIRYSRVVHLEDVGKHSTNTKSHAHELTGIASRVSCII